MTEFFRARHLGARAVLLSIAATVTFASPARAVVDLSELFVSKAQDYVNNIVVAGFEFEGCVTGTGILSGTLTTQGGATNALVEDAGEWCFGDSIADRATLDLTYPSNNTTYTFALTPDDAGPVVNYVVTLNASAPTTFPNIDAPVGNGQILADRDLTVAWSFPGACGHCDGSVVAVEDVGADNEVFFTDPPLGAAATSVVVPGASFSLISNYQIEVTYFDGVGLLMDTQNSDTFVSSAVYEVISGLSPVMAVARTLDLQTVELLKGLDRDDGVVLPSLGHFFEGCVVGTGIQGGTLETPVGTQALSNSGGEFCLEQEFNDAGSLDVAFPSAGETYTFRLTQSGGAIVDLPVVFDVALPGGSIDFSNPSDGATVPAGQDLDVMWALDLGAPPCTPGPDCGDGIAMFVIEQPADMEVLTDNSLAISATNRVIPSATLTEGLDYEIEVETFEGGEQALTDGSSDGYQERVLYEDLNLISVTVPEPALGTLSLAALGALLGLARRGRRRPR